MSDKMKRWKENAKDTYKDLKKLDPDKSSKDQFVLFAACVALLDHKDEQEYDMVDTSEIAVHDAPATPQHKPYVEIVKDEIADAEKYTDMGEYDIARQEAEHAKYFLSKLKAQAVTSEDKALVRELWAHLNLVNGRLQ